MASLSRLGFRIPPRYQALYGHRHGAAALGEDLSNGGYFKFWQMHCHRALLRKSALGLTAAFPVALQGIALISALPRAEKRFMMAMRIWISAVCRSGSRDMIRSPKSFRQFI